MTLPSFTNRVNQLIDKLNEAKYQLDADYLNTANVEDDLATVEDSVDSEI